MVFFLRKVRLVNHSPIRVNFTGYSNFDSARMLGLLRGTWKRIPLDCRRVILAYWHADGMDQAGIPRIEVTNLPYPACLRTGRKRLR